MNTIRTAGLFCLFITLIHNATYAQKVSNVMPKEIKQLIDKASDSLSHYYVNLEMGNQIGQHLKKQELSGAFNGIIHPDSLAKKITQELRSVNGDLHLYLMYRPIKKERNKPQNIVRTKPLNYGLTELKILENNIGYLKIQSFSNWDYYHETRSVISSAMKLLEDTNAIIFDVRDNRGGVPKLVAFLISHLFPPKQVHLAEYTHRYQNSSYGLYTETYIPGKRLPDIPVYVLVNKSSASAAEEFAYFLKHQQRATIVGEVTAGAGYGAMWHRLNDRFVISISSEEDINPVTKSNFEKVGVQPQIKVSSKEALEVAEKLAKEAAKQYAKSKEIRQKNLRKEFNNITSNSEILEIERILRACQKETLINLNDINNLGYRFLQNQPKIAEVIFKMNIEFYPMYSNVYDSYGDALAENKKLHEARQNYQKAVELGEKEQSRYLNVYKENLKKVEKLLKKKTEP